MEDGDITLDEPIQNIPRPGTLMGWLLDGNFYRVKQRDDCGFGEYYPNQVPLIAGDASAPAIETATLMYAAEVCYNVFEDLGDDEGAHRALEAIHALSSVDGHAALYAKARKDRSECLDAVIANLGDIIVDKDAFKRHILNELETQSPAEDKVAVKGTPGAKWRVDGEQDPHANTYDCDRAKLCMGYLTDDELANEAFLHYDRKPHPLDIIEGRAHMPIVYMTAVKERIRWLSRKLAEATAGDTTKAFGMQVATEMERMCADALKDVEELWPYGESGRRLAVDRAITSLSTTTEPKR